MVRSTVVSFLTERTVNLPLNALDNGVPQVADGRGQWEILRWLMDMAIYRPQFAREPSFPKLSASNFSASANTSEDLRFQVAAAVSMKMTDSLLGCSAMQLLQDKRTSWSLQTHPPLVPLEGKPTVSCAINFYLVQYL
jgi:hypothetical protein